MAVYIDADDGIRRVGNNKKVYVMVLKKFNGAALLEDLKNKLASGDCAASQAQAHTIKGLAANLSLQDLREKAADLELALKNAGTTDGADISVISAISESTAATDEAVKIWISENS